MLDAMVAYARGAVQLAEGEPREALVALRRAGETWRVLDVPYEIAARASSSATRADRSATRSRRCWSTTRHGAASSVSGRSRTSRGSRPPTPGHGLSPRELEVLRLVAAGKTNRQIAASLVISEHTVARHVQNIFAKLGLSSRAAATAFAFEHDLV